LENVSASDPFPIDSQNHSEYLRKTSSGAESRIRIFCDVERKYLSSSRTILEGGRVALAFDQTEAQILQAKKNLSKDPRYEAIGSSSFREELFDTFVKGKTPQIVTANSFASTDPKTPAYPRGAKGEPTSRQERRERAVKDREERITVERRRLDANIERSKQGIDKEEGERTFMCALSLPATPAFTIYLFISYLGLCSRTPYAMPM